MTVNVSSTAPASVTNTATVSGGGDVNTANNTASDPTTVNAVVATPDLTISKSHTGNFFQGQTGATYTITVSNIGSGATSGTVTVSDALPTGLTATAISGTGWSCDTLTFCTRSDALAPAASYPAITLTVNVSSTAPASVTNTATVSGGGESNTANDTASDPTTVGNRVTAFIEPFAIAVDSAGNAYVTGLTGGGLPIVGGFQPSKIGGANNAFVLKLNAAGTALVYSSYLGGNGGSFGNGIAVDGSGNALVTGNTESANFPTVAAVQGPLGGGVSKSTNGGASWTLANTGMGSQPINTVVVDPKVAGILYAGSSQGSATGGVYKSTNGGASWTLTNHGLTNLSVQVLAIDPVTTTNIYAGTNGGGVFKSVDGGANWTASNSGLSDLFISALAIDPKVPATIYAGSGDFTSTPVAKSTDGGATWVNSSTGLGFGTVNAIVIDPVTTSTLYEASSNGVSKSTNGGGGWFTPANTLNNQEVLSLVINPTNPGVLYASLTNSINNNNNNNGNGNDIYKSNTGGLTWVPTSTLLGNGFALALDPSSPETVYAGHRGVAGGILKTTDGGNSFQETDNGLNNRLVRALAIDPLSPSTIYAGSVLQLAFVSKVNPAGSALTYSTYLGGGGANEGLAIAADGAGNAYVSGLSSSRDFPTTTGAFQTAYPGGFYSSFAAKIYSPGDLDYATFLDGNIATAGLVTVNVYSSSNCTGICDGTPFSGLVGTLTANDILFGTRTGFNWHPFGLSSFSADLTGTLDVANNGSYQFTLTSDDGSSLYIDHQLVINNGGAHTPSGVTSAPVALNSGSHSFEVNFFECCGDGSGVDLTLPAGVVYGNPGSDRGPSVGYATSIAVDSSGDAYIAGGSNAINFPLVSALQSAANTAYVAELNPAGSTVLFSTFFGNSGGGSNPNLALDASNNILVADTLFDNLDTYPTQNAAQPNAGGGNVDAVVFKINPTAAAASNPVPAISSVSFDGGGNGGGGHNDFFLTVHGSNFVINSAVKLNGIFIPTRFVNAVTLVAQPLFDTPHGSFDVAVFNPPPGGGLSNVLRVNFGAYNLKALGLAAHEAGSPAMSLALQGSDFTPGMVALWNGQPRVTTFVSSTELSAAIPASDLANPGIALVSLTDPGSGLTSKALPFAVTDFTLSANPGDMSVPSGAAATEKLSLSPQFGNFNRAVALTCSGLPQFASCAFSPDTLTPGAAGASAILTLSTTAPTIGMNVAPGSLDAARSRLPGSMAVFALMLPGLAWMGAACGSRRSGKKQRRRATLKVLLGLLVLGLSLIQAGCGGGGGFMPPAKTVTSNTPPGAYEITISGASGSVVHAMKVRLTVQ